MKFLKLQLRHGTIINESSAKFKYGSMRLFYPITDMIVYNMLCTLLDRTPKPQFRVTDDKYMPFYKDIMDVVMNSYIKVDCVATNENITTIKKASDSNSKNESVVQYTWTDCKYCIKENFDNFKDILTTDFNISKKIQDTIGFEKCIKIIRNSPNKVNINNLNKWLKSKNATTIANLIENNKKFEARGMGKRVYRGNVTSNKYNAIIYIPLSDKIKEELDMYSKGWTTMLDGGVLTILEYGEILKTDLIDFEKISDIPSIQRYDNNGSYYQYLENKTISVGDVIPLLDNLKLDYDINNIIEMFNKSKNISTKRINYLIDELIHNKF